MKQTIIKCSCDYCEEPMSEFEYADAVKVTIRVDLPNPKGGCGQCSAIEMHLCNTCSKQIGIENQEIYHKYTNSQSRLRSAIDKYKNQILSLCFKRKSESD